MKKGFTLLELMVVVIIIGILSAIAVPQYMESVDRSRSSEAVTYTGAIAKALGTYIAENNHCRVNVTALPLSLGFRDEESRTANSVTFNVINTDRFTYFVDRTYCFARGERTGKKDEKTYTIISTANNSNVREGLRNKTMCVANTTGGQQTCAKLTASDSVTCPAGFTSTFGCYVY